MAVQDRDFNFSLSSYDHLSEVSSPQAAVDTALDRIRKEVEVQKQKSDAMCKLKTAHDWQVAGAALD